MKDFSGIGFVGLGQMGQPMASRLADVPGGLTVFDVDAATAATLVTRGATMTSSVAHLAERCDLICVMVGDDEEVRCVVTESLLSARPGTVLLLHSTIRPATAVELAGHAALLDVHLLDAAVAGGPAAAEQGRLTIVVGGPEDRFEAVRPVLDRMGDLVLRIGDVGSGVRAKLARTLVQQVSYAAAGEAARLAEAAGIDPAVLGHVVRHSDAALGGPGAVLWRESTGPFAQNDPLGAVYGRMLAVGERELRLAVELADELAVTTPLGHLALEELGPALGFPRPAVPPQGRGGDPA
jgi:3-hydroxyisobutyrate dehydrogenase